MKRRIPGLAVACLVVAGPALAQSDVATRAEETRTIRESKAATPSHPTPGKVERVLAWIETGPVFQRLLGTRDGLGVGLRGIENGAGFAAGPSWRSSNVLDGSVHLAASAAASIAADRELAASVALPHVAAGRLALGVDIKATHLAREQSFGPGMGSALADVTLFSLDSRRVTGRAMVTANDWLRLSATAGTTAIGAPGLGPDASFAVFSLGATTDYRDVPQNPRRGGRYHISLERYADTTQGRHSFTRVDTEVEQHLSAWKRQRMVTVRAIASAAMADPGHDVPFYLQRTLGGARLLRGFVTDRFRDRALLVMQAEYAWDLSPFLNAVLFYEAGAVAPRLGDLSARDLRRDYGIGFRFGSARTVALRTDVALGSGEGTRLTMRFNHAF
jgi:outer membrane translocation and assembly module TamA